MITRSRSDRIVVELCRRLGVEREYVARSVLAGQTRDRRVTVDIPGVSWPVDLFLTPTKQRLGGERFWFRCPDCDRRCGVLLSPGRGAAYRCRLCLKARYLRDCPAERPRLNFHQLQGWAPSPYDVWKEIAWLAAPRRRGVIRGRRVRARALRLLAKAPSPGSVLAQMTWNGDVHPDDIVETLLRSGQP